MTDQTVAQVLSLPIFQRLDGHCQIFARLNQLDSLFRLKKKGVEIKKKSGKPSLDADSLLPASYEAEALIAALDRVRSGTFKKIGPDQWQYQKEGSDNWLPEQAVSLEVLLILFE